MRSEGRVILRSGSWSLPSGAAHAALQAARPHDQVDRAAGDYSVQVGAS